MKEPIILIGGGGHCKSCIDVIEQENKYRIVGILDLPELVGSKILGYDIIGTDDDFPNFLNSVNNYLVTVGQIKSCVKRIALWQMVKKSGATMPVIVSPYAYVAKSSQIGEGSIIMHHALINAEVQIGINCIINSKALIEHEASVGDFCHISTGAIINGQTRIGNQCFIGSNSTVSNNVSIVGDTIIAAGLHIISDINVPGVYKSGSLR
ncbi:MAG: NeuD/PglB/VioB family sugar acetyltransferase [Bacteroidales bacterium]|nr:NeuD/PglB/VioB family sugar acetyltransferase [Bacteroidales bacterium]